MEQTEWMIGLVTSFVVLVAVPYILTTVRLSGGYMGMWRNWQTHRI